MRVNVYEDEIRDRVEPTVKFPKNAPAVKFVGIQFFVGHDVNHTPGDDDTSAVVFWSTTTLVAIFSAKHLMKRFDCSTIHRPQ